MLTSNRVVMRLEAYYQNRCRRGASADAARVYSCASEREEPQPIIPVERREDGSQDPQTAHGAGQAKGNSRHFNSYIDRRS